MNFISKRFHELNTIELYEILKARSEVFNMEQKIHYQNMDDIDYRSIHCFFMKENKVNAYLRAYYESGDKEIVKIGRVLTLERGKGVGKELLTKSLTKIKNKMKCKKIIMDAQKHAVGFYEKFGFETTSTDFLEEGVVHVVMELKL